MLFEFLDDVITLQRSLDIIIQVQMGQLRLQAAMILVVLGINFKCSII